MYDAAVQRNAGKVAGHLPLEKPGNIAKTMFYFFKADKKGKTFLQNQCVWKGHKHW